MSNYIAANIELEVLPPTNDLSMQGRLKPEVFWIQLPAAAGLFTFLYFCLITSKFIYFQHEAKCSEQKREFSPL